MGLNTGQTIVQGDFINQAQRDSNPVNDADKAPKNEPDGRLSPWFTRNGAVLLAGETLNGATLPVPVWQSKVDNELYACDANDNTRYKFIGFVISNSTNGNPITFQGSGIVSGFTGLQEGEKYYVQDTVGTIGTNPGTHEILVGIAISETQLLIRTAQRRASGIGSLVDAGSAGQTQDVTVTLGFRPNVIRFKIHGGGNVTFLSDGVWQNGVYSCTFAYVSSSNGLTGSTSSFIGYVEGGAGSIHWQVIVLTVTDTGFTLRATQQINAPTAVSYSWEAEGEL